MRFSTAAAVVAAILLAGSWAAGTPPRPALEVTDEGIGCAGVAGRYVALFHEERGILVLSASSFPGARRVGSPDGGSLRVDLGRGGMWAVTTVSAASAADTVWAARYGFRVRPVSGCAGFDKDRFSAEGDLASYVSWLVETVYARLPADERRRSPAFRLADRTVRLRVSREGSPAVELEGREGATLACRFADSDRIYLAIPYVLDPATARLAVEVDSTEQDYFTSGDKTMTGFVVTDRETAAFVDELGIAVRALDVRTP